MEYGHNHSMFGYQREIQRKIQIKVFEKVAVNIPEALKK